MTGSAPPSSDSDRGLTRPFPYSRPPSGRGRGLHLLRNGSRHATPAAADSRSTRSPIDRGSTPGRGGGGGQTCGNLGRNGRRHHKRRDAPDLRKLARVRTRTEVTRIAGTRKAGASRCPRTWTDEDRVQFATVYVPGGQLGYFLHRLDQYATEDTRTGKPKNANLVERISALRLATIRELWSDHREAFPEPHDLTWWEVWLRRSDGNEVQRLEEFASASNIVVGERRLVFDTRVILLVRATATQLRRRSMSSMTLRSCDRLT